MKSGEQLCSSLRSFDMQIGDRVIVNSEENPWNGETGTVIQVVKSTQVPVVVEFDDQKIAFFDPVELLKESLCDDN